MGLIHTGLDVVLLLMIAFVIIKLDIMQRTIESLLPPAPNAQETQPAADAPESA